jgi:hypothetical protein
MKYNYNYRYKNYNKKMGVQQWLKKTGIFTTTFYSTKILKTKGGRKDEA